ncbi:DUF4097 domain-containing protein [Dethiobacter alkaliphilus]|uniref:DUF4097 domain-containing protein n=1 Tax=Dethiobacter alkaliphilus TaxID=427926 RepID=UPI002226CF6E|nr:DUF4097 domain-containing protein [Dethiobacter alkaliphilus]MCW3490585.1 DUF4097 domain-containing protein [Dethiobacter alkaliphilus]
MLNLDMKKIVMILLSLMIVSFAIAGILGAGAGSWTASIVPGSLETIDKTHVFESEELQEIIIETISTDINIIPTEESTVKVHLYGEATPNLIPYDFARQSGNRISVDVRPKQQPGINLNTILRLTLDVYVPGQYTEKLRAQTVSGDLLASDLSLQTLAFKSVSGKLRATDFNAEWADLSTTSGNLSISGFAGELTSKTVSGDVTLDYKEFANNITVSTTSGNTTLILPEDAEFSVQFQTVSGKANSDFPITVDSLSGNRNFAGTVGSGENRVQVRSVSGNLEINK